MSATQICPDCGLVHNGEHVFCPFFKGQVMPHPYEQAPDPKAQKPKPGEKQGQYDQKMTRDQRKRKPKEWEYAR
jgi:hypothetical protein